MLGDGVRTMAGCCQARAGDVGGGVRRVVDLGLWVYEFD